MKKGDVIADRFVLEARAATGGMGTIFRALDRVSGQAVAVKTWSASPGDADARGFVRFTREAAALAAVDNPAIVRYVAHGATEGGEPYLVMQWVAGADLASRLRDDGLSVKETLTLARRLIAALSALHARGIVHRDVKPANVMLEHGRVDCAVLVDLGVARSAEAAQVTASGARVGTPCYMAPEQIRDARSVDGRADVFALGCIVFECLTGVRAFQSEDVLGVIAQILLDGAPDPRTRRPQLPAELARFTLRLLASDRAERPYADAALDREVSELIEQHLASLGPPAQPVTVASPLAFDPTVDGAADHTAEAAAPARAARELTGEWLSRTSLAPADPLLGRELELTHLEGALATGSGLLALWGPAGIGKTRLVLELVRRVASLFERSWFIDLSQARDGEDALRIVAGQVGARVQGAEAASSAVGRALANSGQSLILVDAIDGVAGALLPHLGEWRQCASNARFVLTSRERLRAPGALNVELGPLPFRSEREVDELGSAEPSPAAKLFAERARSFGAPLTLEPAELRLVERIVQAVEGIPLAIELAAGRLQILGLAGVLARIAQPLELLAEPAEGAARRPNTLRDAIQSSYELLSSAERSVLLGCAVFSGNFDVAAAEAVLIRPEGARLVDILQLLRDKSLLRSADARLALSSLVRDFAVRELAESGQLPSARARHAAYFARRAEALASATTRGQLERIRRIEAESDDLIAATETALATANAGQAVTLLLALEPVIAARGALPSYLDLLDRVIAVVDREVVPDPRSTRLWLLRARLHATAARFASAYADLERTLQAAQRAGDAQLEGQAWLERGVAFHLQRDLREARSCYERALVCVRSGHDRVARGRCYGNLGAVLHDEGKLTEAAAHYWKAIQTLEETGEVRMLANFFGNLAVLEQELGSLAAARRHYEKASALLLEIGDPRLRGIVIGNQGTLEAELGDWLAARRQHERALELLLPLEDPHSIALCRARLGAALATLGFGSEAEEQLSQALAMSSEDDRVGYEAVRLQRAFLELAWARSALGAHDLAEAEQRLAQAVARCEHVRHERAGERSLLALSDDVRAALRTLAPLIAALQRDLRAASLQVRGPSR